MRPFFEGLGTMKVASVCLFFSLVLSENALAFRLLGFRSLLSRRATETLATQQVVLGRGGESKARTVEDLSVSYSRTVHSDKRKEGSNNNSKRNKNENTNRQNNQPTTTATAHGRLILVRCGQSEYNANGTFTGWCDPPLTERGVQESEHAARLLLAEGYEFDTVYTSKLQRAIKSTWTILSQMDALFVPVHKTFRLNQRHYGSLQGLSKAATAQSLGVSSVQAWRRSLKAKPPALSMDDPTHAVHDRRYASLPKDVIPSSESLWDCQERARPLWESKILPDLQAGKTVLVVAHEDSLKGIVKEIHGLSDEEAQRLNIPKGVPSVFRFDKQGNPLDVTTADYPRLANTTGVFLEKPGRLSDLMQLQKVWQEDIGLTFEQKEFLDQQSAKGRREHTLEASMRQLRLEQNQLQDLHRQGHGVAQEVTPKLIEADRWTDDPSEFEEYGFFAVQDDTVEPTVVPVPGDKKGHQEGPIVVLIRHGRTPHNNLGLFTGWEDPPLADGGVDDARNAGQILRRHGFEFDVVYTSWLTRAIQTAYYVLDELDSVWLPIVKSWRLNERMYGALTGKSKKMVSNEYGEEQLKKWRRGYTIRPPSISSYSINYPGNDERRAKHIQDLPISWLESVVRSVEQRKLVLHRKFPKTESLKDCMDRSIPFYTKCIQEEAVNQGKRVLITSHENAIRGILMHLCDIPEEDMNQLHLPNGLPLVYNVRGRCITLLDDGTGVDPMDAHDFGPAAKYLFKPCEISDEFYDEMLQIDGNPEAERESILNLKP